MADATPDGFASELRREIMRSEIQRVQVLAVILVALLLMTGTAIFLSPELVHRMFRGGLEWWVPWAGFGPFALYEVGVLFVLWRRAAQDKDFPRFARFANAFIETSLPSAVIFELSKHMEATTVFGYWPPLLYFVFILLSTLRLDFWLSLWTGAVAAVEQFALAAILLPIDPAGSRPEETLIYHFSRSVMLMLAGVAAAIVARTLRQQFENSVAAAAARDRVTNLFGQHVSPVVVEQLLADPAKRKLGGEERVLTVLFCDLANFTGIAERHTPQQTIELLSEYFACMTEIPASAATTLTIAANRAV